MNSSSFLSRAKQIISNQLSDLILNMEEYENKGTLKIFLTTAVLICRFFIEGDSYIVDTVFISDNNELESKNLRGDNNKRFL